MVLSVIWKHTPLFVETVTQLVDKIMQKEYHVTSVVRNWQTHLQSRERSQTVGTSISTRRLTGSWKKWKRNCTLPSQALSCSGSKGLSQPISQQSRPWGLYTVENTGTPGATFITNNPVVAQQYLREQNNANGHRTEFPFITIHNGIHILKVSNPALFTYCLPSPNIRW